MVHTRYLSISFAGALVLANVSAWRKSTPAKGADRRMSGWKCSTTCSDACGHWRRSRLAGRSDVDAIKDEMREVELIEANHRKLLELEARIQKLEGRVDAIIGNGAKASQGPSNESSSGKAPANGAKPGKSKQKGGKLPASREKPQRGRGERMLLSIQDRRLGQGLAQQLHAALGDAGAVKNQHLQPRQALEPLQTGVGYACARKIEHFNVRQSLQVHQFGVAYLAAAQIHVRHENAFQGRIKVATQSVSKRNQDAQRRDMGLGLQSAVGEVAAGQGSGRHVARG